MKKIFVLVGILAALFIKENSLFGQEVINNKYNSAITKEDAFLLTEFDETSIITELKQKGIPESEFNSIIRHKKLDYINAKKGIVEDKTTFFSFQETFSGPCDNAGFESGDFTNWMGATGMCDGMPLTPPTWTSGFVSTRHTITSGSGYDSYAINITSGLPEIPLVAPGSGTYSTCLGNSQIGAETEYLRYQYVVSPIDTSFIYKYAVVLENPAGHTQSEQPRFDIKVFDASSVLIYSDSIVPLAASGDTTYKPFNDSFGSIAGYYKKWTTDSLDLTSFIGTAVTIQFQTSDCTLTGHFGYAYIDCSCNPSNTDIFESIENNSFDIFPNPVSDDAIIRFHLMKDEVVNVSVINILGEKIATIDERNMIAGKNELHWNTEGISDGIYLIQLQVGGKTFTKKLIVTQK